ncbi:MAG: hypothetical protein JXA69_11730 [Phycisphaerae bacterium]|nr:hypothetical protein [Phycisphaerae bacterium]
MSIRPPVVGFALAIAVVLGVHRAVLGHPLGNNSITHFSVLYLFPDRVEVDFLLDIAEAPAARFREDEIDLDKDGEDTVEEQRAWLDLKAAEFLARLTLQLDGEGLALIAMENEKPSAAAAGAAARPAPPNRIILAIPGFAGMPTYRLLIRYVAALPPLVAGQRYTLDYEDSSFPNREGLARVIIERPKSVDVHEKDRQYWDEGTDPMLYDQYDPIDMPHERTARIVFSVDASAAEPGAPAAPVAEARVDEPLPWQRFTDPRNNPASVSQYRGWAERIAGILEGGVSVPALALIALLCFGYGAAHALAPGHAKTIVAAYLISLHGTYGHAVILALIVTVTHSALVIVVGLVFLIISPEAGSTLQLWLGVAAGAIIVGMGGWLTFRAITGRLHSHVHSHDHDHVHSHEDAHELLVPKPHGWRGWLRTLFSHSHPPVRTHTHSHTHDHSHAPAHEHRSHAGAAEPDAARLTIRLLLWLGVSGGIVPCPAATWMMLAAVAQNRVPAGLFAVGTFSLGLALTLMAVGFLALSSRRFADRLMGQESSRRWLLGILPALGGAAVMLLGGALVSHYAFALLYNRPLIPWFG